MSRQARPNKTSKDPIDPREPIHGEKRGRGVTSLPARVGFFERMGARSTSLQHGEARGVKYSVSTEFDRHYVRGGGVFHPLTRTAASVLRNVGSLRVAFLPVPHIEPLPSVGLAHTRDACCRICVAGNGGGIIFPNILALLSPSFSEMEPMSTN